MVAAKAREMNPYLTAVTIGFDDKKYDESEKAIEYAKHLKIKHHHVERFSSQSLLEVIDEMREHIESGDIVEFVATSICADGETQIHSMVGDLPTAVGLYEIGKHMIIQQEAYE